MTDATQTLTLTGFVLARIAEDEAQASAARSLVPWVHVANSAAAHDQREAGLMVLTWRPSRVLAQCEAHRRIIELAWDDLERIEGEWGSGRCREQMEAEGDVPDAVRALAAVYADHEGFRDEWLS